MEFLLILLLAPVLVLVLITLSVLIVWPRIGAWVIKAVYPSAIINVPGESKIISLVFDDGPDPETTLAIAEMVRELDVPATFFLIGSRADRHAKTVKELSATSNEIGAHFFFDRRTAELTLEEVQQSHDRTIAALAPYSDVTYVRPGFGLPSSEIESVVSRADMKLVVGDIPAFDTIGMPDWFYFTYLRWVVRSGSIVTFHDVGERGERTLRTLPKFVEWARKAGYKFVGLDGLYTD